MKVPSEELVSEQRDPLWQYVGMCDILENMRYKLSCPNPTRDTAYWTLPSCVTRIELLSGRLLGIRLRLRMDLRTVPASTEDKQRVTSLHHRLEVKGISGHSERWPSATQKDVLTRKWADRHLLLTSQLPLPWGKKSLQRKWPLSLRRSSGQLEWTQTSNEVLAPRRILLLRGFMKEDGDITWVWGRMSLCKRCWVGGWRSETKKCKQLFPRVSAMGPLGLPAGRVEASVIKWAVSLYTVNMDCSHWIRKSWVTES